MAVSYCRTDSLVACRCGQHGVFWQQRSPCPCTRSLDGAEKWKFKTDGRVPSTPAVANGAVFFLSYDSNFYAVDAASGALKWKFATGGERRFAAKHLHGMEPAGETMPDPFDFFLSSPAVAGGIVFFGSSDTNVYALDAANGALKWKFKTGDVVHSSPALF